MFLAASTARNACGQDDAKSSPEARALFADAANFQNNGAFELAVEEWKKFLATYAEDPLAPKARHYLGVCHLQRKQYAEAIASLSKVIADHADFDLLEDTYLQLGWSQYSSAQAGKKELYAPAAATFAKLIEKYPEGKYVDQALYFQGESLYLGGNLKKAAYPYTDLVNKHKESPLRADAMYALGVTHQELERFDVAGKVFRLFLKTYPDHELATEVKMRTAETVLKADQFDQAEKLFAEVAAVEGFGNADHAVFRQAFCAAQQDKSAEAAGLYVRVVAEFPKSAYVAEATMNAGRAYYRANKFAEATEWLGKVMAAGGKDVPEAAHWLCRVYLKGGKAQQAADAAAQALPAAGESPFLVNLKMDRADAVYALPGRQAEAMDLYDKIHQTHPRDASAPQALYNAAFAAQELAKFDVGLKHAETFIAQYPQDGLLPDVQYVAAECNLLSENYAEARALFAQLIAERSKRPELGIWQVRLGLSLYLQEKYREAIAALEPVVETLDAAAAVAEARFLIGSSQFRLGQHDAAVASLTASLDASAQWAQADEALLNLALAQRKLDRIDDARKSIERLIAEFPKSSQLDGARFRLAEFSYADKQYKKAIAEYDRLLGQSPKSTLVPHALFGKGWAQLQLKDYAGAAESLTALIENHAGSSLVAQAHFARAKCRQQTDDFDGGAADVDVYLKSNPKLNDKSDALYVRALCESGKKDAQGAAATLTALLDENPKYASADKVLYELAWAQSTLKQAGKAEAAFARLAAEYPDSSFAAEAFYHVGQGHYANRKFQEAAGAYAQAAERAPEGELGEKVAYKLAWSKYQLKDYAASAKMFSDQVAKYPAGSMAADGVFMQAECLFKVEQFEPALAAFAKAKGKPASNETIAVLIRLHGGQCAAQLEQWEASLAWLAEIPEKYPESNSVAMAEYEMGWAQQNLDRMDEALKHYRAAAAKSRSETGARATFMIGEAQFGAKKYAEAVRQFQRVMYGYGGEKAPPEIKRWQAKAGFEAGQCSALLAATTNDARKKPQYVAAAKKFFQYVIDKHPDTREATGAAEQLEKLGA